MATDASLRLTPTQLAGHLACPHLTQLERRKREGTLTIDFTPDPRLEALRARGLQHEETYVEALRCAGRSICDLRGQRDPMATSEAMAAGFDAIVQAPLGNDVFFGIADVLLRVGLSQQLQQDNPAPCGARIPKSLSVHVPQSSYGGARRRECLQGRTPLVAIAVLAIARHL